MMTSMKTVAIVGAGPCGLAAVKTCLEEGYKPTAFDKLDSVGGMWNYDNDTSLTTTGRVYKSLVTNTSTVMSCYSDFPFPEDSPPFVPHKEYLRYFNGYADHFKLRDHIQLKTEVVKIEQAADYRETGRWDVNYRQEGHAVVKETFDFVMICSGYFSEPYLPTFPGQEEFTGEILHTCQFRTNDAFVDKNILIIGESFSSSDVAVETSTVANQVYLSSRHGFWIYPRRAMGGWPFDVLLLNRFSVGIVPGWLLRWVYQQFLERDIDYDVIGIKPGRKLFEENFAVNDFILSQITCGKIRVRSGVKRFIPTGVEFEDGTKLEGIDVVVMGTGYNVKTPFIDDKLVSDNVNTRDLYKYVFPVRLPHATLACIGSIGTDSSLTPVGELQARWSLRVFKGHINLPPKQKMLDDISEKAKYLCERYGRPKFLIPGVALTDELSAEMGCYPSLKRLFVTDPKLAVKVFFAPITPFTYRLLGPHSWPGARNAVMNVWNACLMGLKTKSPLPRQTRSKSAALWLVILLVPLIIAVISFLLYNTADEL